jgi:putative drug exporter of the RND superfamily
LKDTQLYITGTTASLIDLRTVITQDNRRIKIAVMLAVLAVLVMVIRRIGLCLYLIATVLLSYYATLGLTVGFFRWAYGNEYVGLDWKLPVFLFVILMAIGQDYNVYLVARILEEEKRLGWLAALRRAVSRTGGIITACGLVMAATFFSMTSSAWMPSIIEYITGQPEHTRSLRGIVELGFALGLGMLVDTLYVRTVLVPSFVAVLGRRKAATR